MHFPSTHHDYVYLNLLERIIRTGERRTDRTGVGTYSLFGEQLRFDLTQGFPLLTTKKVHWPAVVHELLWFLMGETNVQYLRDNNVTIWDEWADEAGELGPVYGKQWRAWRDTCEAYEHSYRTDTLDQIAGAVRQIKTNPDSRRIIVSAWNVAELSEMALQPCHMMFQFYVSNPRTPDAALSCHMYQRSADIFLGVPFNIASYALLTHMVAAVTGLKVKDLVISFGDVHLYSNHIEQAREQLTRIPRPSPKLIMKRDVSDIDAFVFNSFKLEGYDPHPAIKAPVAV